MTVMKTSMRNFFAHKGRMALSAVAVLLSVAFVCGTLVFTDTMNTTFDKLFATTSADVTVSPKDAGSSGSAPTGVPASMPTSVLKKLRSVDGVSYAEGAVGSESVTVVNAHNKNIGADTGAPTIVGDWTRTDAKALTLTKGHIPRDASEAMVDADTMDHRHLKIGDTLRLISATGDFKAKISGVVTFKATNPGAAIVYIDHDLAQRKLLGTTGRDTQFYLTAAKGVTDAQLKQHVTAALGTGYKVQTAKENADDSRKQVASFLNVMKYAMLGFAGIAFLVGIFLIINTFSMLVAQRTREIGLMRAIGSSRRQVNRSVLIEAVLLGIVGSVVGVGAGVGLALGLMKLMAMVGMKLSTADLTVKWTTPVAGVLLGVIVTVVAAYVPARRAGKVSPMAALRDAGSASDTRSGVVRAIAGVLFTAAGAVALWSSAEASKAAAGASWLGFGVVLTLIGFIVIGPLLASGVVRVLSLVVLRLFGPVGRMAERNALRNPRRTGATGAALMIGLALVACLSVVGSSMVASATSELDQTVGADFILQSNTGQPIVPQAQKAMASVRQLDHVTHYIGVPATITAPDGASDHHDLTAASATYATDVRHKTVTGDLKDAYGTDAMSVGDKWAKKHHVKVGDRLTVAFEHGRTAKLRVAVITSDDVSIDKEAMFTNIATAKKYVPAASLPQDVIMFAMAKNGQEQQAYTALKKALAAYPQYKIENQTDFKQDLKNQVGQLLNMVYGLLALAIIVAVLGVVNTLALSVVERTREIGLMRAIGLSRRQLRRMIRLESMVIALFGALLGLGLGMVWGTTAQKLLALQGMKTLEIPWSTILTVFVASAFVGLLAALVPAFRAGRMNVLGAIAAE